MKYVTEQSKDLLEETKKDAEKPQNFKGQAEITSGFAIAFTGQVPLLSVNEFTPGNADGGTR